jgi:hypothetical protein
VPRARTSAGRERGQRPGTGSLLGDRVRAQHAPDSDVSVAAGRPCAETAGRLCGRVGRARAQSFRPGADLRTWHTCRAMSMGTAGARTRQRSGTAKAETAGSNVSCGSPAQTRQGQKVRLIRPRPGFGELLLPVESDAQLGSSIVCARTTTRPVKLEANAIAHLEVRCRHLTRRREDPPTRDRPAPRPAMSRAEGGRHLADTGGSRRKTIVHPEPRSSSTMTNQPTIRRDDHLGNFARTTASSTSIDLSAR